MPRDRRLLLNKKDFSQLTEVQLCYNLPNIFECLLNICELRMSQPSPHFLIDDKRFQVGDLCDELALRVAINPKIVIQDIRRHITYVVRRVGTRGERITYLGHEHACPVTGRMTDVYSLHDFDVERMRRFTHNQNATQGFDEMVETFTKHGLIRLLALAQGLLNTHISYDSSHGTHPTDIVRASSFMMNIMRVAGYGRALKCSAAAKSAEDTLGNYNYMDQEVEQILLKLHDAAISKGYSATTSGTWIQRCISYWKSTSAGLPARKVDVTVTSSNGKKKTYSKAKISKKLALGASSGDEYFRRKALSSHLNVENPGITGTREVPYRATRLIYVVPLHTLHAMVAVTYHLINYISSKGEGLPYVDASVNAAHFATGTATTSGVRILDNISTIIVSGKGDYLALDGDLSEFDSHNVYTNFRKPMIRALLKIINHEKFGPDRVSYEDMVHYAFGEGTIHNTKWDVGRKPLLILKDNADLDEMSTKYDFMDYDVVDEIKVRGLLPGASVLKAGRYSITNDSVKIEDYDRFFIGFTVDGSDLFTLTSEGSGELTTLMMNTVANLAIQNRFIEAQPRTLDLVNALNSSLELQ